MFSLSFDSQWGRVFTIVALVVLLQFALAQLSLRTETKRRLQHALTGHALVQISYLISQTLAVCLLLLAAGVMYVLKTYYPTEFRRAFGPLLRRDELSGSQMPGAFYFLLGAAGAVLLADNIDTARYAVECLAIADPMASWVGTTVRSRKINSNSSVAGSAACFAAAWCVGYLMLTKDSYKLSVGALACTIAEAMPYGNDNLNIPVITALAIEKLT